MGEPYDFNSNKDYNNSIADNVQDKEAYVYNEQARGTRTFAIVSLVLGILSVVCCCLTELGLVIGIAAIVFALVSRKMNGYFDSFAITGLIFGIFGAVLCAIVMVIVLSPQFQYYYEQIYNSYFG
jgi:uncharacterized membrane protein